MKKEYDLEGISCGGCANNVKLALLQHPDITEVEVEVHPPRAVITMNKTIFINELQALLKKSGHYGIKEALHHS